MQQLTTYCNESDPVVYDQLNDVASYSPRKKHQRGGWAILVVNNSALKIHHGE